MPDYCPICARENRNVKLDEIGWSERNRWGGRERVFHCSRCGNEATLPGLKMLATQVTAPKRIRTAEPEPAAQQQSKEEYEKAARYHFRRGDTNGAVDFLRLAGYNVREIDRFLEQWSKEDKYRGVPIFEERMKKGRGIGEFLPEKEEGSAYLSARAYLQIGKSKPMEVNAVMEEPKYFPEILVNKPIPFDNLPVPPGRYQLLAKFESPEYGLLKARYPTVDSGQEYFTIQTGQRLTVNFIFRATAARGGGGGGGRRGGRREGREGRPIDIDVRQTTVVHGGGGAAAQPQGPYLSTLGVIVQNEEGRPVPHAHVWIHELQNQPQFHQETDNNGRCEFNNVPASLVPMPVAHPVAHYTVNAEVIFYDNLDRPHQLPPAHSSLIFEAGKAPPADVIISLHVPSEALNLGRTANPMVPHGPGHDMDDRFHMDNRDRWEYDLGQGARGHRDSPVPEWLQRGPVGWMNRYSRKAGRTTGIIMSLVMIVLGIVIAAITGIWQFVVGLACLGGFIAMPMPSAWEREYGTMWKGGNAWKTGQAAAKLTFKVACIFFIGWALWDFSKTSFPFAALIFIGFAFVSYFSLPGSYNPEYPYEVMGGMIRFFIGFIVIPFMIFNGIFQSFPLALISLAFFAVVPTPTKTKNLAQIMGVGLAGTLTTAEMLDKIIFIGIMIWGLAVTTGTILIPLPMFQAWAGQWGLTGDSLYVFYAIWFISAIGGFFSPPETRPYTGILMLATALVLFGLGPGSQTLGGALFGEWWPSIHNTVIDAMKPFGEMFGQIQSTFGQSWLLLSCPTCYARQITEGNFVGDDISKAGAFGLEIDKFQVQSIYPEEPFTIQINLANKGTFKARNIRLDIVTTIDNIELEYNKVPLIPVQRQIDINTPESFFGKTMTFTSGYGRIFVYTINFGNMEIERQDVKDLFIVGKLPCPVNDRELSETREKYIPFVANLTYTYDSESTLQIDFISEEEWKRLSVDNKLVRGQVPSKISSAPAKLSLGTADQPIKENNPFNLGFNISSAEGPNSHIDYAQVWLTLSSEFGGAERCQGAQLVGTEGTYNVLHFDLGTPSKASFCFYPDGLKDIKVPKKTYTLSANASYVFNKWDEKDTLINFRDVCWAKYLLANPNNASQ